MPPIDPRFLKPGIISPQGQISLTTPTPQEIREGVPQAPEVPPAPVPPAVSPAPAPIVPPTPGPVTLTSSNPAINALVGEVNRMLGAGQEIRPETFTPELRSAIDRINALETDKLSALASAREAAEGQDTGALDEALGKVDETEATQKDLLTQLMEEQRRVRETFIGALVPTERETELGRQLNELRTERQLLPLELRKEGISAEGIRAGQIEDERVRAIQEQNLLFELGLEQEARQFAQASAETQLGFIRDDLDLTFKIEDRLRKEEENIVDRAQKLSANTLNVLSDIVSQFEGLAWEDMDATTQSAILNLATPFPDLTPELISDALKNAKQQQILSKARGEDEILGEKDLTPKLRQDIIDTLTDEAGLKSLGREITIADLIRLFPNVDREALRGLMDEFLVEVDFEDSGEKRWWELWK